MNGLYEYAITGDGDMQMASCFLCNHKSALPSDASKEYIKTLKEFEDRVSGCRIGYVPGVIRHHYHGSLNSRKYDMREYILTKHDYDPIKFLSHDKDGLLVPTSEFPFQLRESIQSHFKSKNEDATLTPVIVTNLEITTDINIVTLLEKHFNKSLSVNCILINIKKDTERFESTKEELKKISITKFINFDATHWKDVKRLEQDLFVMLDFLKTFNCDISTENLKINEFSEANIGEIQIQSGPLACFCSHIRSLIHAYCNFEDYVIMVEDDISIDNIDLIAKYIQSIPDDWDIICMNSKSISHIDDYYYKFHSSFYHLHFYIIKTSCLPTIFKNLYPITDQIDIMIGNLHDKLNIYNITNTVTQKNFTTNIQNNLHIVYNTPVYAKLRHELAVLEDVLLKYIDTILVDNHVYNLGIAQKIIEDVVYTNVFNNLNGITGLEICIYVVNDLYIQLQKIVNHFVKDHKLKVLTEYMYNEINYIIDSFTKHNELVTNIKVKEKMKAYNFGSTSSVYILKCNNLIVKAYNSRLRWKSDNHDDITKIFKRELEILKFLKLVDAYDDNELTINMKYKGESLYNNFKLPSDYKEQIVNIFKELDMVNIYYPEFNLNNIVVLENIISFIDYGLAEINIEFQAEINRENCKVFIEILNMFEERFKDIKEDKQKQIHILYNTFMNNMREGGKYTKNIF